MNFDIDIFLPFIIIFLITFLTILIIYPSARFTKSEETNDSLGRVYNPLWFFVYGFIFYSWCVLSREGVGVVYYLVYFLFIFQLLSLSFLYYFMNENLFWYLILGISSISLLLISALYRKIKVFFSLIINILLFLFFFQNIKITTWKWN